MQMTQDLESGQQSAEVQSQLPPPGKIFWVRVEEEKVTYFDRSPDSAGKECMQLAREVGEVQKEVAALRVPVMRCCRKLGNLYRR